MRSLGIEHHPRPGALQRRHVGLARLARAVADAHELLDDPPVRVVVNRMRSSIGWSEKEIAGMVEGRPDWCISRQRTWGVPIALFIHKVTPQNAPAEVLTIGPGVTITTPGGNRPGTMHSP